MDYIVASTMSILFVAHGQGIKVNTKIIALKLNTRSIITGFKSEGSIVKLLFKPNSSPLTHCPFLTRLAKRVVVEFKG